MLTVGSLFAGIGGFDLGLERAGMRVIWQSEIDPYASAVLRKHWPEVPNHGDIRLIRAGTVERPDVICGGFPCQPFSHAGKRAGKDDDRHLWPEMCRVIDELRPAWVIGENVAGIISMELDQVLSDLESLGYATRTFVIPAVAVDAPHRRDRCWIIATDTRRTDADRDDGHQQQGEKIRAGRDAAGDVCDRDRDRESACAVDAEASGLPGYVADADKPGSQRWDGAIVRERARKCATRAGGASAAVDHGASLGSIERGRQQQPEESGAGRAVHHWLAEPDVGRGDDGLSSRLDRLGVLSNEAQARADEILRELWGEIDPRKVQRSLGGFHGISQEEVLLAFLCEHAARENDGRMALNRQDEAEQCLRGVWRAIETARSPLRPRRYEQRASEFANALRVLSRKAPSLYPQAWRWDIWEDGTPRVAQAVKNRVDRLRCLGNAIVPQIAEILGRAILESEAAR